MKKNSIKITLAAILLLIPILVIPTYAGKNNPNKIHGSPEYVLNILGKKEGWNANGDFDNPDRHTIFIPEYTPDYNVTMHFTQGSDFAVLDGTAFDDNEVALQIGQGRYYIYIVALGKPGGNSKIWAKSGLTMDSDGNLLIPLMLDYLQVKRVKGQPFYQNTTDMFYVSWDTIVDIVFNGVVPTVEELQALADLLGVSVGAPVWIFDFLNYASNLDGVSNSFYFWEINNQGNKHLQMRFY
jgi:hypothetical protein